MRNYLYLKYFEKVQILEDFPQAGRVVPEFNKEDVRELIYGIYRIVYKTYDYHLDILTVHHSARLLSDIPLIDN